MMKIKVLLTGIVLFLLFSCSISALSIKTIKSITNIDQAIHDSLSFTLDKYIYIVSPFFESIGFDDIKKNCAYYCVLFFDIKKDNYFMLFTWVGIPKYFPFVKKKSIYFYIHNKKKIV